MRRLVCAVRVCLIAVIVGSCPCSAENRENLAGGVLITHYVPELVYSLDPPAEGWCNAYTPYAITDAADQNVRIDGAGVGFIWYVLAAWTEEKVWCGVEFGLGAYSTDVVAINSGEACYPGDGLEIPDPTWPAPNTGTAMMVTTTQWTGNYVPVYYFDCYAYGGAGQIALAEHVHVGEPDFAGFWSCEVPPVLERATLGALGVNMEGVRVSPWPPGACCVGTTCQLTSEGFCGDLGGEWLEGVYSCTIPENPCDPMRACCLVGPPSHCVLLSESQCAASPGGGTWLPNLVTCEPDPCFIAACCQGQICTLQSELACLASGGEWSGSFLTCDAEPCEARACCHGSAGQACSVLNAIQCEQLSGVWHPEYGVCEPSPCSISACCLPAGPCVLLTEVECLAAGGQWLAYTLCSPNPCPRVCCSEGACSLVPEAQCQAQGGLWFPAWGTCSPNPCPQTYVVRPDGSGDYPTIQAALNAASHGDIIELASGTFRGPGNRDLDFLGKAVTVCAQGPDPDQCIIDCEGSSISPHRGVWFHSQEGAASLLRGVTIAGGVAAPQSPGGAIRCEGASPTIIDCVLRDCQSGTAAAVYCRQASPALEGCTLGFNCCTQESSAMVSCTDGSSPVLDRCLIVHNVRGCAVACEGGSQPSLTCCDLFNNEGGDWTGCISSQFGQEGNFREDPITCAGGPSRLDLACDSPCLDRSGCGRVGALGEGCDLYGFTAISDVPNDEGRAVRLRWHRACVDRPDGSPGITFYSLWRRIDQGDRGGIRQADALKSAPDSYPPGEWEYLLSVPACCEASYATVAPTLCDSTHSGGQCWSSFFLRAHTAVPSVYFDSAPDSGYSLDNLAPAPPEDLRKMSPALLSWDPTPAPDFDYYNVYGSRNEILDPDAVLLGRTSSVIWPLDPPAYPCYHVTAVDYAGNEGTPATLCDYSSVMDPGRPTAFSLRVDGPHPLRGETRIVLDLPDPADVDLRIYDLTGRAVATLASSPYPPGRHRLVWDGSGPGDRRMTGVFYLKLKAGELTAKKVLVVVQ